jgi:hypothetical protein
VVRLFLLLAAVLLLAACQGDGARPAAVGSSSPTVAGGTPVSFSSYAEGRAAFTRASDNEVLTATLEDAAWLRLEGDAASVARAHRAYFEYGYTSFQVVLQPEQFSQPTKETFLLEDSKGGRVQSKPVSYQSTMAKARNRYHYTFDLSFQHALTADLRWVRLTREADGSSVTWNFP